MEDERTAEEIMQDELALEYRRLLSCYQIASRDDKNVVWAALNKYLPNITMI